MTDEHSDYIRVPCLNDWCDWAIWTNEINMTVVRIVAYHYAEDLKL